MAYRTIKIGIGRSIGYAPSDFQSSVPRPGGRRRVDHVYLKHEPALPPFAERCTETDPER